MSKTSPFPPLSINILERFVLVPLEERVHPIPFRTRQLSSPSSMILHILMWESRTVPRLYFEAHQSGGLLFLSFLPSSISHSSLSSQNLFLPLLSSVSAFLQGLISSLLICLLPVSWHCACRTPSLCARPASPYVLPEAPESNIRDGDTGIGTV